MLRRNQKVCKICSRPWDQVRLEKCVVCHAYYCRSCAFKRHGKAFCGRVCAEVFFFGSGEEEDR